MYDGEEAKVGERVEVQLGRYFSVARDLDGATKHWIIERQSPLDPTDYKQ
jgi:hypothetical protein